MSMFGYDETEDDIPISYGGFLTAAPGARKPASRTASKEAALQAVDDLFCTGVELPDVKARGEKLTKAEWAGHMTANGVGKNWPADSFIPPKKQVSQHFFGANALMWAMKYVFDCKEPLLDAACCWNAGEGAIQVKPGGPYIVGQGVHAKVYLARGRFTVLSSQNNAPSPLCEHAVAIDHEATYDWWYARLKELAQAGAKSKPKPR